MVGWMDGCIEIYIHTHTRRHVDINEKSRNLFLVKSAKILNRKKIFLKTTAKITVIGFFLPLYIQIIDLKHSLI